MYVLYHVLEVKKKKKVLWTIKKTKCCRWGVERRKEEGKKERKKKEKWRKKATPWFFVCRSQFPILCRVKELPQGS